LTESKDLEIHVVFDERDNLVWWDLPSLEEAQARADGVRHLTSRGKLTALTLVPKRSPHE
jgi:hypothetical protein